MRRALRSVANLKRAESSGLSPRIGLSWITCEGYLAGWSAGFGFLQLSLSDPVYCRIVVRSAPT